ncbi:MAG: YggS family pyridoxal phosphate-dependent enzyme [Syntrophomonadaceae bacterium]|nr:YggS family pyridoxal phosphate-dependent enzyme [Syntrophomonadaceae bacterium]
MIIVDLQESIAIVRNRIVAAAAKSGRTASDIMLVAVSKTVDSDTVRRAYELGITDFGENRVQEFNRKIEELSQARWHLIGRLQTNKAKDVVGRAALIHSLDRWNLAEELNKRGLQQGVEVSCLLQVNIAGEEQKAGIEPDEVNSFLESLGQLEALRIDGLMTMAPLLKEGEKARPVFKELYHIKEIMSKNRYNNVNLRYLSMGMSQDYEVAIEEGANIVRVGSAIFHPE